MQVVDMETGDIVWRVVSEYDPDAGEPISLPPAAEQREHELAEAIYALTKPVVLHGFEGTLPESS
jgi:hypothetical protein